MSNAKFKLTSETVTILGKTLFRVEATASFGNVEIGEKGGFIEKESNLSKDGNAWVSGDAWVYGDARVSGNAWVSGNARVSGDAWVSGNARVSGDARVYGDAWVYGNACVSAKKAFTKGWFIAVDDDDTPKVLSLVNGSDGYWKNTYVLGDYEIKDIDEPEVETKAEDVETIVLNGKTYRLVGGKTLQGGEIV